MAHCHQRCLKCAGRKPPGFDFIERCKLFREGGVSCPLQIEVNSGVDSEMFLGAGFLMILLEAPLISYAVAPDWTPKAIDGAKAWVGRHWRRVATVFLTAMGAALVARGLVGLIG